MYQQFAVAAVTDVPAVIATFAQSIGWTIPAANTVQRPGGGEQFAISASITGAGTSLRHRVFVTRVSNPAHRVFTESPMLNGSAAGPAIPSPSKLHMIGGLLPEPYIAAVIEYGFNLYRHIYIGNMEKLGAYSGGEVISANLPNFSGSTSNFTLDHNTNRYLFCGRNDVYATAADNGGVNVVHADNPNPWRTFKAAWSLAGTIGGTVPSEASVLGGYTDGPNDPYLSHAKSAYAGSQVLVPINLWCPKGVNPDMRYVPIGRPAGVRQIRMDGLDPGSSVEVGNKVWRVFPELSKKILQAVSRGTYYAAEESSYFAGLAYLEN